MKDFICEVCGKKFKTYAYQRRGKYITCSRKCFGVISRKILSGRKAPWVDKNKSLKKLMPYLYQKGKNHPHWKGGRLRHSAGYIFIYCPEHPNASQDGYVLEHRLIMEKNIGRYLTKEEKVHHINKKTSDNRIENLVLFSSQADHIKYHIKYNPKFFGRT